MDTILKTFEDKIEQRCFKLVISMATVLWMPSCTVSMQILQQRCEAMDKYYCVLRLNNIEIQPFYIFCDEHMQQMILQYFWG